MLDEHFNLKLTDFGTNKVDVISLYEQIQHEYIIFSDLANIRGPWEGSENHHKGNWNKHLPCTGG